MWMLLADTTVEVLKWADVLSTLATPAGYGLLVFFLVCKRMPANDERHAAERDLDRTQHSAERALDREYFDRQYARFEIATERAESLERSLREVMDELRKQK